MRITVPLKVVFEFNRADWPAMLDRIAEMDERPLKLISDRRLSRRRPTDIDFTAQIEAI